ncbi:MAG: IS21 family transposase [Ruminococcaceae bacterium]|nr:IS21 family transposase [Oscillospiraceae bacterium]
MNKIRAKEILEARHQGLSMNEIAKTLHVSKHSVSAVCSRAAAKELTPQRIGAMSDNEIYILLFPEKEASNVIYAEVDYDYVTAELKRTGVTMKLLHEEYTDRCRTDGTLPVGYTKFCTDYKAWRSSRDYSDRIVHKPGVTIEVDWSGPTMSYVDRQSKTDVTVYLFVATLPYSQYTYVEACPDMKQTTWVQCNVNMLRFFKGVPLRIRCDNLKTGVISHPKEGDIVLNDQYINFAEHYGCAILPAGVRKPKHKPSVEGNVGNIATAIIAKLRDTVFYSFQSLSNAVEDKLYEFNHKEFNKRDGSRYSVFTQEELPVLSPLPEHPYELCDWFRNRTVQLNSHVCFEKNYYSCHYSYLHQKVDLKVTATRVEIYCKGVRVQIHDRISPQFKNRYSTKESDMPEHGRYLEWNEQRLCKWASDVGPSTTEVINRLFNSSTIREQAILPALSILKLTKKYSSTRLEDACELALTRIHSPRWKNLNSILNSNQDEIIRNRRDIEALSAEGFLRGDDFYENLEEENT